MATGPSEGQLDGRPSVPANNLPAAGVGRASGPELVDTPEHGKKRRTIHVYLHWCRLRAADFEKFEQLADICAEGKLATEYRHYFEGKRETSTRFASMRTFLGGRRAIRNLTVEYTNTNQTAIVWIGYRDGSPSRTLKLRGSWSDDVVSPFIFMLADEIRQRRKIWYGLTWVAWFLVWFALSYISTFLIPALRDNSSLDDPTRHLAQIFIPLVNVPVAWGAILLFGLPWCRVIMNPIISTSAFDKVRTQVLRIMLHLMPESFHKLYATDPDRAINLATLVTQIAALLVSVVFGILSILVAILVAI